jgi:uncharacterized damage-inducible protein DinB
MAAYVQRPAADEYVEFYAGYVARVPAGDIVRILAQQLSSTLELLAPLPPERAQHAYAPGKWTIGQVVGHLADAERIMAARALRFARGDTQPLPGFDENAYVPPARFEERALDSLAGELRAVRAASVALFDGLPPEAWTRRGSANGHEVSVRALACIIAGHELHHRAILSERYLARPVSG